MAYTQEERHAVNISRMKSILQSAVYPASRDELVVWAENEDASPHIVNILQDLPDRSYTSSEEVGKELGNVETTTERRGVLSPMTEESAYME